MARDASNRNNDVRMCTPRRSMKHSLQKQVKRCALNYELAQAREEFILVSAEALHSLSVEALSVQTLLTLHCMNTARSGIFVGTTTQSMDTAPTESHAGCQADRPEGHPRPACPPAARSTVTVMTAGAGERCPLTGLGRGGHPPRQRETRAARSAVPGSPPSLRAGASRRTRGRRRPPGGRGGARTPETAGTRPRR